MSAAVKEKEKSYCLFDMVYEFCVLDKVLDGHFVAVFSDRLNVNESYNASRFFVVVVTVQLFSQRVESGSAFAHTGEVVINTVFVDRVGVSRGLNSSTNIPHYHSPAFDTGRQPRKLRPL